MARAAIYARVSTLTGQSPQMQLDVLREYAARRELEVAAEFVDHGLSGARDHRPELDRLMNGARQRAFDVVLVYRFDRFARGVRHLVGALDEFEALGIEFVSYSESLDTSTRARKDDKRALELLSVRENGFLRPPRPKALRSSGGGANRARITSSPSRTMLSISRAARARPSEQ